VEKGGKGSEKGIGSKKPENAVVRSDRKNKQKTRKRGRRGNKATTKGKGFKGESTQKNVYNKGARASSITLKVNHTSKERRRGVCLPHKGENNQSRQYIGDKKNVKVRTTVTAKTGGGKRGDYK